MLTTNIANNKYTLIKLLKGWCTKIAFIFNNVIYGQVDGVSMWSCLGPTLANIIVTELEIKVVDSLFGDGLISFTFVM